MTQPPGIRDNKALNILDYFDKENLFALYQPIVSVGRKTVSGIEGLIRGTDKETGKIISPAALFDAANAEGLILEFDRLCRDKVLETFSPLYQDCRSRLLFINLDPSVLDKAPDSDYFYNQVRKYNIEPENIVIEINETKAHGNTALKRFTDRYKSYGFLLALDDVGTGFSNMDRILLVKPDIIKLDMAIVRNINTDYYKQGIFKALVNLANEVGALVVAEGVETLEEAIKVLKLGGHMIQGYYFSKPQEISRGIFADEKISYVNMKLNEFNREQMNREKLRNSSLVTAAKQAAELLSRTTACRFGGVLADILSENSAVECAYILDINGIQVSDTVRSSGAKAYKNNRIYYSAKRGADHSVDRYYYPLVSLKLSEYITEPYISLASGNLCTTVSTLFANKDSAEYILCMDFLTGDTNTLQM